VPSRLRLLIIVLALFGGAAGGCAGGRAKESNAYAKAFNDAQQQFVAASSTVRPQITLDKLSHDNRAGLARYYRAVDRFVAALRAIDPPARIRALHDRLIATMVRFGASLRAVYADVGAGSPGRILDAQQGYDRAVSGLSRTINPTIAQINAGLKG
jgi:hypothetical protein